MLWLFVAAAAAGELTSEGWRLAPSAWWIDAPILTIRLRWRDHHRDALARR